MNALIGAAGVPVAVAVTQIGRGVDWDVEVDLAPLIFPSLQSLGRIIGLSPWRHSRAVLLLCPLCVLRKLIRVGMDAPRTPVVRPYMGRKVAEKCAPLPPPLSLCS